MFGKRKKLSKPKTQKQSEENKINSIRNHFILKKKKKRKKEIMNRIIKDRTIRDIWRVFETEEEEKERKKKSEKKKEIKDRIINDRIIRDINTLLEEEAEGYYKPKIISNFWRIIIF